MDHRATRTVTVALTTRPWIISGISVTSQEGRAAIRVVSTADDADTAESRAREVLRELRDRIDEILDTAADGGPDVHTDDLDAADEASRYPGNDNPRATADGLNWLIYNRRGASGEIRSVDANPYWLLIDIGRHDKVAQYAIWRATGAVYLLDQHGAVADDELYRP